MDEFGILTQSIGFKPQGKSAPMASLKRPTGATTTGTQYFGSVSDLDTSKLARNSNSVIGSFLGDPNTHFRSFGNQKTQNYANSDGYSDIFGAPIKNSKQSDGSSFDYDSIFNNGSGAKASHNKAFYGDNDDIFGGMMGLKSSEPVTYDDVFTSFASSSNQSSQFDDLLGNLGRKEPESKSLRKKGSGKVEKSAAGFDDLIPGFRGSSSTKNGASLETCWPQESAFHSTKSTSTLSEDPFVVLESTSTPANTSSGIFSDPLEQISQLHYSGSTKLEGSQKKEIAPSRFEENMETADDAWLNVSEIPVSASAAPPSIPPPPKPAQILKKHREKSPGVSPIDELEDFAMGRVRKYADKWKDVHSSEKEVDTSSTAAFATTLKEAMDKAEAKFRHAREVGEGRSAQAARNKEAADAALENQQNSKDDLESFFSMGSRPSSVPRSRATTFDPVFDTLFHSGGPEVAQKTSSGTSPSIKKAPSAINIFDLSSIFEAGMSSGEFQEVEGESEERRRARLERHQRTQARMAQALSGMNQRNLQTQQEQEERHRIAETLDGEIKRWAAGKEGNLRSLLSTLQFVLWAECGWKPVSLTDMITSASVKKVYQKANLCIHPDKVQQKGANLQQKYIAEKVFDILKEAWNKFNTEELS